MVRFKRGLDIIDKVANTKFSEYWSKFSYYVGFILMLISIYLVYYGLFTTTPTLTPLVPGVQIHGIYFPIIPTLIAIFFAAFVHEFSHGVVFRKAKVTLKSWGIFFLGPFLGAFVEPREEEIPKMKHKDQISAFNAGSAANVVLGIIAFGLLFLVNPIFSTTYKYTNVTILRTINNSPAYYANVSAGAILLKIDNQSIHSIQDVSKVLSKMKPGDIITLYTTKGVYKIKLGEKNGRPFIGIWMKQNYKILNPPLFGILSFLISLLGWIFIINLGIGIANMLPIYPLDGGRLVYALLDSRGVDAEKYTKIISTIVLISVIINVLLNFI